MKWECEWRQSSIIEGPFEFMGPGQPETTSTSTSWVKESLVSLVELHSTHLHLRSLNIILCPMALEVASKVLDFQVFVKNSKGFLWSKLHSKSSHLICPHLMISSSMAYITILFYYIKYVFLLDQHHPSTMLRVILRSAFLMDKNKAQGNSKFEWTKISEKGFEV